MNKTFSLFALTIALLTLNACSSALKSPTLPAYPTTIQDPLLRQGWAALYSHQEAIRMPDGSFLTGRDLAQFIVDRAIPVRWAPVDNNRHASYSLLTCQGEVCTKENQPIYFSPSIAKQGPDQLSWLVECMAHEIYHEMQPFGQVANTRFEEYSAYYVSTHVSQSKWAHFKGYDPLNPVSLTQWFTDQNLMYAYQDFDLYPMKILPAVKHIAPISTFTVLPIDQVITLKDSPALDQLKGGKACIIIDSTGQELCEPSK